MTPAAIRTVPPRKPGGSGRRWVRASTSTCPIAPSLSRLSANSRPLSPRHAIQNTMRAFVLVAAAAMASASDDAQRLDQCGLLVHMRRGDTVQEKCEKPAGCMYTEGDCIRDPDGAALEGMCMANTYSSQDIACDDGFVSKDNSQAIYVGDLADKDKMDNCCERDVGQLFSAIDGDQDGSLTKTEATGAWALSNDMPSKVLTYLTNSWTTADTNGDGTLSANELEDVYTDQMDVTLTATSRWLRRYCPEERKSCNADVSCYNALGGISASPDVTVGLRDIITYNSVDMADVAVCVTMQYKNDCVGDWSPCTASCDKTYSVTSPRDDLDLGDACEAEHGDAGTCTPGADSGCHKVLPESVYSLYQVGANFDEVIPSYEWPDCQEGKTQQKFTFEVDIQASHCLFPDGGCCSPGSECPAQDVKFLPCPEPCVGEWSACDEAKGQSQQLQYTIITAAEEGGSPCEFEHESWHMVDSCPADCVGECKCGVGDKYDIFKAVEVSIYGGSECPTDSRVDEHKDCANCEGAWEEGVCEEGSNIYTFRISNAAVNGKQCAHADGETKSVACAQDCEGEWVGTCVESKDRIDALHSLAGDCGNDAADDAAYNALAASTAAGLPSWWPYPTADWKVAEGRHIPSTNPDDFSQQWETEHDLEADTMTATIDACEDIYKFLAGAKIHPDQDDSEPPCGYFFGIDNDEKNPKPDPFTCAPVCAASVAQLIAHCEVYGMTDEAHCAADRVNGVDEGCEGALTFGGNFAEAIFERFDDDDSDSLSQTEVVELCKPDRTSDEVTVTLWCGPPADGSDTWVLPEVQRLMGEMTAPGTEVSLAEFAAWFDRPNNRAMRWNPCPFLEHCTGTQYKVYVHTQTAIGDGKCCPHKHGEVHVKDDCDPVSCVGEWEGECVIPGVFASAEHEALVEDKCRNSRLAGVECAYAALPSDASVQLQFYHHTSQAKQCGTSCMFSEGEHQPIRCEFQCVGSWDSIGDDDCLTKYTPAYETCGVGTPAGPCGSAPDNNPTTCPYGSPSECTYDGYEWRDDVGCVSDACGSCDSGWHVCDDCCKPDSELCTTAAVTAPSRGSSGGGDGGGGGVSIPAPAPASISVASVCPEPAPVVCDDPQTPAPTPAGPALGTPTPAPTTTVVATNTPTQCDVATVAGPAPPPPPGWNDPCDAPEPEVAYVDEVTGAATLVHGSTDYYYSSTTRQATTGASQTCAGSHGYCVTATGTGVVTDACLRVFCSTVDLESQGPSSAYLDQCLADVVPYTCTTPEDGGADDPQCSAGYTDQATCENAGRCTFTPRHYNGLDASVVDITACASASCVDGGNVWVPAPSGGDGVAGTADVCFSGMNTGPAPAPTGPAGPAGPAPVAPSAPAARAPPPPPAAHLPHCVAPPTPVDEPPPPTPQPVGPIDCVGEFVEPCCGDVCVEHEIYTISQPAAHGGKECKWPDGITRPYTCTKDCDGHWEGDCDDADTDYLEYVVTDGCGAVPAHCADEQNNAQCKSNGQLETDPNDCEADGGHWVAAQIGKNCYSAIEMTAKECVEARGTPITAVPDEESCQEAALTHDPPLALGSEDAAFGGCYASAGCYYYSSGPFSGTAFWSTGSDPVGGDKVALTVDFNDDAAGQEDGKVLCNVEVATPDYHAGMVCGSFPQIAIFKPIIRKQCPRDCAGHWVGDCITESHLTCSDLYDTFPCNDNADPTNSEACHEVSGWNHNNAGVCAETDQFQSNHFVSDAVPAIHWDHPQDGHACREMSNFVAALEMCECAGARLCTIAELEDDVTAGTGCNFDMARVWSSSRTRGSEVCNSPTERWTAAGASEYEDRFPAACRDFTELLAVRCCADTHIGNVHAIQQQTYRITTAGDGAGAACPFDDGSTRDMQCGGCDSGWSPSCTIDDVTIDRTYDAAKGLPAKFGFADTVDNTFELTLADLSGLIDPARLLNNPFCQCAESTGFVETYTCPTHLCPGSLVGSCDLCNFLTDPCAPEESCAGVTHPPSDASPSWVECKVSSIPCADDTGCTHNEQGVSVVYGPAGSGECTVTQVFKVDDGFPSDSCPHDLLGQTHDLTCNHPVDCIGHYEGDCEQFLDNHENDGATLTPDHTNPFETFRVTQAAANGGQCCEVIRDGEPCCVEEGEVRALDCDYKDCKGEWVGECGDCTTEGVDTIKDRLEEAGECSFCGTLTPVTTALPRDQCLDLYKELNAFPSPCGFRLVLDNVPDGHGAELLCTADCKAKLEQFAGGCNGENNDYPDLACVSVDVYHITQQAEYGAKCTDDAGYELFEGLGADAAQTSTKLRKCSQDCLGEWSNPHADSICEGAGAYKTRVNGVVAAMAAAGFCGPVAPTVSSTLTASECVELMDTLNGVGDEVSPCGFNLAIAAQPADPALCTAACRVAVADIQYCSATYDLFAGAVQYELHTIAREACNGGSKMTCGGDGEVRRRACASSQCTFEPEFGDDPFNTADAAATCGRNPPQRDCVGGWRFPIDAAYTEWGPCVNGKQYRVCQTEAAFGGNNDACKKDSNGAYMTDSKECAEVQAAIGGAVDPDLRDRLDQLERQLAQYESLLSAMPAASAGGIVGPAASAAEAPVESSSAGIIALSIGGVALVVAAVAVGVRASSGNSGRKYLDLDEESKKPAGEEENVAFADERGFSSSC